MFSQMVGKSGFVARDERVVTPFGPQEDVGVGQPKWQIVEITDTRDIERPLPAGAVPLDRAPERPAEMFVEQKSHPGSRGLYEARSFRNRCRNSGRPVLGAAAARWDSLACSSAAM